MKTRKTVRFASALSAVLAASAALVAWGALQRQAAPFPRIAYELRMSQPASHLFEVSIDVTPPADEPPASVDFQMPRWQPGRYSVADFAKNVQEFSAVAGGQRAPFRRIDDHTWRVEPRGSRSFTVSYKVFGNDLSGTFAQLDAGHANYNGGEIFMYIVGRKQDPVELRIHPPPGWRVINASSDAAAQTSWKFPNYEILIDNPTEIGPDWTLDEFDLEGKKYRVVVHSRANEGGRRQNFVRDVQKIVDVHTDMWGAPEFDRYTFLFHFAGNENAYDGMEHLTSTQIIRPGGLADPGAYDGALGAASHEFFHVWNVKRLRPVELGPWDWTRPANTPSLWLAEGFTEYYGNLMMRRAGLWNDASLFEHFASSISEIENAPGSRLMSAVEASLAAPFIDAAVHRQRTNLENTSISYYTKGELIALALDLWIRGRTNGRLALDDVLRQMYDEFYLRAPNASYYLRGRGYTPEDFVRVLSSVVETNMSSFYERHIAGVEPLPYDEAFAAVGLRLVRSGSGRGVNYRIEEAPNAPSGARRLREAWLNGK